MISAEKLNTKAFQELVLYYLRERITHKNIEVKHLVPPTSMSGLFLMLRYSTDFLLKTKIF